MAIYFLLGLVLGIILGAFLYELMRGLVTILLRKRAKRSLEELVASYKDGLSRFDSRYSGLDASISEEKPN